MVEKIECPEEGCSKSLDPRGLHGHLAHVHDIPQSEALERAEEVKQQQRSGSDRSGEPGRSDPGPAAVGLDDPDDELDAAISELVRRRIQREKLRSVRELDEADDPDPDDSVDPDPMADVERVVALAQSLRDLTDDGGDGGGLTADEARRIVREEADREPATDGGGVASDPITAAVENGAGPEEIQAIADAADPGPSIGEVADRAVGLLENSDGLTEQLTGLVAEVLAARRTARARQQPGAQPAHQQPRQQPMTHQNEPETDAEPAEQPADDFPGRERLERAAAGETAGDGAEEVTENGE